MATNDEREAAFWSNDPQEWLKRLNSSVNGLSDQDATTRLRETTPHKKIQSSFEKDTFLFLRQFKSPLMLLLIGAVIISALLGDSSDVFIILFIVLSSGILSFFQERNAGKVVEKLQKMIAIKCTVLRNGKSIEIPVEQLVPGDVVLFKAGDLIPADCLILEANELHANEASLTGESYPARKEAGILPEVTELAKRSNCLWQGTNVVSGNARALVIFTGENTRFGAIAKSTETAVETAFEKGIRNFGYFLMRITLILSVFILLVNIFSHKNLIDSALFALALAVGMAPELLPAIITIAMSAGAKRLLNQQVIVKKLASIQNLGEVNLLCTDKTGTITTGVMEISSITDAFGNESPQVRELAFRNATLESGYANPIDEALRKIYIENHEEVEKTGEIPYDFIRKRLSIAYKDKKGIVLATKGAYAQIMEICSTVQMADGSIQAIEPFREEIDQRYAQFGLAGQRAIGVCFKTLDASTLTMEDEKMMTFAGFIRMEDPVKAEIGEAISELKKLHVGLKIITGDNKNVARSIALKIGIKNPVVLTGSDLQDTSPEALVQRVKHTHIFAEVEPQQKERIILALKQSYTVAYMGDGINDVAAINAADVGISVDNAVDIAKEAADFVLMQKRLRVIADGIREGRKTFSNTLKYIFINSGSTFGNMFSMAAASLILPFLPMLPKQILLTNFLTDFPYLSIASDNVDEEQINRPGKWSIQLIRKYMVIFGLHSSIFDMITFFTLYFMLKAKPTDFQTGWFIESILTELFILFIIRTHKNFFKSHPGKLLTLLSALGLAITLWLPYSPINRDLGLVPLPVSQLAIIGVIIFSYITTADLIKVWFFRKYKDA